MPSISAIGSIFTTAADITAIAVLTLHLQAIFSISKFATELLQMQAKCYFAQTDLDYRRNADGNPIVAIAPHSKQIQTAISIQEHFIATQESITKDKLRRSLSRRATKRRS
ncbi:MAG: hypothetical protein HC856_03665 [Pseudanabaena sp. RU_4_16]|nr:hypothetical protein [Pseudanabaena sp. RU_4_16]